MANKHFTMSLDEELIEDLKRQARSISFKTNTDFTYQGIIRDVLETWQCENRTKRNKEKKDGDHIK